MSHFSFHLLRVAHIYVYNYKTIKSITFYDTIYVHCTVPNSSQDKNKLRRGCGGQLVGQFCFISGISKSGILTIKGHFGHKDLEK